MATITLKTVHIAQVISRTGGLYAPQLLADMIDAGTPVYEMGRRMAFDHRRLQALLDGPDPIPEKPMNWHGSLFGPFTTPFAGSPGVQSGYTSGPPKYASLAPFDI